MIAMLKLAVFGFLFLGMIFLLVSIYSRSVRREKLEKKWDAEVKTGDRDAYIESGMAEYEQGAKKKLIWLIFIVPIILVIALVYLNNFY